VCVRVCVRVLVWVMCSLVRRRNFTHTHSLHFSSVCLSVCTVAQWAQEGGRVGWCFFFACVTITICWITQTLPRRQNFEDTSQWISVRGYTTRHFPAVRQKRCPLSCNSSWRKTFLSHFFLLSPNVTGPPLARHTAFKSLPFHVNVQDSYEKWSSVDSSQFLAVLYSVWWYFPCTWCWIT